MSLYINYRLVLGCDTDVSASVELPDYTQGRIWVLGPNSPAFSLLRWWRDPEQCTTGLRLTSLSSACSAFPSAHLNLEVPQVLLQVAIQDQGLGREKHHADMSVHWQEPSKGIWTMIPSNGGTATGRVSEALCRYSVPKQCNGTSQAESQLGYN